MLSWLKSVRWWSLALFMSGVVLVHLSGAMHGHVPGWVRDSMLFVGVFCLSLDWMGDRGGAS